MFFKGALMDDPAGVLVAQGPNSRSALRMEFTSRDDVTRRAGTIATYIENAIAVEDAGLEVGPAPEVVFVDDRQEAAATSQAVTTMTNPSRIASAVTVERTDRCTTSSSGSRSSAGISRKWL